MNGQASTAFTKVRLILIFFGFCMPLVYAADIPILNLSKGHGYSLITEGGISVTAPQPNINQFILNTNLQIQLGHDRVFTITSTHKPFGVISSDHTNITFISVGAFFQSIEQTKHKLQEMRPAFRWNTADFNNWPYLETGNRMNWLQINESELPFYAVKVSSTENLPGLPPPHYPYSIELTFAWDTNSLEKLIVEIGMIRRKSELDKH